MNDPLCNVSFPCSETPLGQIKLQDNTFFLEEIVNRKEKELDKRRVCILSERHSCLITISWTIFLRNLIDKQICGRSVEVKMCR